MVFPGTFAIWLPIGISCFGLLFVFMGGKILLDSSRRRRTWLLRPGRIISSRSSSDAGIRFQVAFEHEGAELTFWNRFTSGTGFDPVGTAVEVRVNPQNPSDAVVVGGVAARGPVVAVCFLIFGVIAVVVGMSLLGPATVSR